MAAGWSSWRRCPIPPSYRRRRRAALRLPTGLTNVTPEAIARSIGDKKLLLVLDNCEHLIEAVATLAETLLAHCPHITIIATSRETLRIQGEHVYRVPPLEVPAAGRNEADHILNSSAVELFIARINAWDTGFSPRACELPSIGAICRHLDGIPLAIEFAAAHASTLGLKQVAARLHDRFALLTRGRRTALPRHRTLRGVLDWSYDLLSASGATSCCGIWPYSSGGFTVEAAAAVANEGEVSAGVADLSSVMEDIANLVAKSLVVLDRDVASRWYLLETIRAYALEKLTAARRTRQRRRGGMRCIFAISSHGHRKHPARAFPPVTGWAGFGSSTMFAPPSTGASPPAGKKPSASISPQATGWDLPLWSLRRVAGGNRWTC